MPTSSKIMMAGCELPIPTPGGEFRARYSARGLCGLAFPAAGGRPGRKAGAVRVPAQVRRWHAVTVRALRRALAGRPAGALPPLDLSAGTAFQQRVWGALRRIGRGQTRSYGQVARAIGQPNAARAVGTACGANPIPVFVPCHRVLAADRRLGGFSGGLDWKRALLRREGVQWRGDGQNPDAGRP
ncbi:MAG TPA: methylated-DNA--[protein]-cysteine S-methyltransferase [Verrucomicrobiota bacterium]|nr:methylated-DNA--[protein]-cysteine S-methyltransferase [Verrucomicrobiota bacterium]HRR63714.1 methylated-DNA--[protein]-cysteine S-methyltransferase [Candidatus Paceibacterota bacterium]NLH85902.1 methylated-DNA--[protein]-cysteine S-methyltransferase [Verrucomicrobiota bacterium]HNR71645.1 methylated-DNA--[protein]-cysteine S-methyltransferase [Verrucomicrobiota bacterium]HNS70237.1 methylated-DNA--[protein]-cysteine S-methyltransferase [Verrucomicrobiota bacterium]